MSASSRDDGRGETEQPVHALLRLAHHEAGHAVAMYRLGFGVRSITLEGTDPNATGECCPRRVPHLGDHETAAGRAEIEQYLVALHAGNAAERHLDPDRVVRNSLIDHAHVHRMLQWMEDDTAVEFAWCSFLWQRAYAYITDPRQWRFVQKVARRLLDGPRTLAAEPVNRLLDAAAAEIERDRTLPDFMFLGRPPVNVRSPWHARWYQGNDEQPFPRYELGLVAALHGEPLRRERDAAARLPGLEHVSKYTRHILQRYGITTLHELARWSPRELAARRGIGKKTLRELTDLAARFGVSLGAEGSPTLSPTAAHERAGA